MQNLSKKIEKIVDKTDPKIIDKITIILFMLISIISLYFFISTFKIIVSPILNTHSRILYSFVIITDIALFYITMLGDKTSKPVNRPKIFFVISLVLGLNVYSLLVEIINGSFTSFLNSLVGITEVPSYLLITNIRIMSIYVPIFIVIIILYESFAIPFKKDSKNELLEYSLDILTRNINEVSHRTINLKMCEDVKTGKDVILSESSAKQHTVISGSSGSGKTALVLKSTLAQLFNQKALFREKLKELSFKCIEQGICYIKMPITHKYINENFSMDFIGIRPERRGEFLEIFKDYIIGIRESKKILYSGITNKEQITIPLKISPNILKREICIKVYFNGLIEKEYNYTYENDILNGDDIRNDNYSISVNINEHEDHFFETLIIELKKDNAYKFEVNVIEHSDGKIIYKDVGITVVAPDGGLPSTTIDIANENGIKIHKIDPKMEEIEKGTISKFNPMMVGTPEKAADVISSILVAMERSTGKDANPYFLNASIRAIRNIVILLRVTYFKLKGKNPTLVDVLDILNDFNSVREYVEELQRDSRLETRWKSVIDYFISSFYPQPKDDKGNLLYGTNEGVKRKKTEDAVSGIINQLDNLLGREELRYILCDGEEGLNLSDLLENGECIAIATRQSELGNILGKAFALMFILSIQNAVLCRFSEDENPEKPHYLVIDELPFYLNDELKVFFTFSRKYNCSLICAIQNIAQLCEESEVFKQIIFSNTDTKIILPGSNVEDRKYYSELLGNEEIFETQTGVSRNPIFSEKANYSETTRGNLVDKAKVSTQEISELKFKRCYYIYTNSKGKKCIGKGYLDFLKLTADNTIKTEYYNFEEYNRINNEDDFLEYKSEESELKETTNIYKNIEEVDLENLELDTELKSNEEEIANDSSIVNQDESTNYFSSKDLNVEHTINTCENSSSDDKENNNNFNELEDKLKEINKNLYEDIEEIEVELLEVEETTSSDKENNINQLNSLEQKLMNFKNNENKQKKLMEMTAENKYNIDIDSIELDDLRVEGLQEK